MSAKDIIAAAQQPPALQADDVSVATTKDKGNGYLSIVTTYTLSNGITIRFARPEEGTGHAQFSVQYPKRAFTLYAEVPVPEPTHLEMTIAKESSKLAYSLSKNDSEGSHNSAMWDFITASQGLDGEQISEDKLQLLNNLVAMVDRLSAPYQTRGKPSIAGR